MILFITGLVKGKLKSSIVLSEYKSDKMSIINEIYQISGNGAGFIKILERLIRGVWTPTAFEFLQPSL